MLEDKQKTILILECFKCIYFRAGGKAGWPPLTKQIHCKKHTHSLILQYQSPPSSSLHHLVHSTSNPDD